jgi:hypothetical protein
VDAEATDGGVTVGEVGAVGDVAGDAIAVCPVVAVGAGAVGVAVELLLLHAESAVAAAVAAVRTRKCRRPMLPGRH